MMKNIFFYTALLFFTGCCALLDAQNVPAGAETVMPDSVYKAPLLDSTLFGADICRLIETGPGAKVDLHRSVAVDTAFYVHLVKNAEKKLHGYRIRLFFDNKQNARGLSEEVEKSFMNDFPSIPVYRSYTNPYFKVAAGDFRTKSDALRALQLIRESYPKAFVVKDIINYTPLE